jgi:hypothetical protein
VPGVWLKGDLCYQSVVASSLHGWMRMTVRTRIVVIAYLSRRVSVTRRNSTAEGRHQDFGTTTSCNFRFLQALDGGDQQAAAQDVLSNLAWQRGPIGQSWCWGAGQL